MKEYYLNRLHWIFKYTNGKWWYIVVKTLCLIVGAPIYAVSFVVEMLLTAINMLFSWIPVLNVVVMVLCKLLINVFGATFYICILPDIKQYKQSCVQVSLEEIEDEELPEQTELATEPDGTSQIEQEQAPVDTTDNDEQ